MAKNIKLNKNKLIKLLEENPNLLRACKKVGVARSTVYRWMESDKGFDYLVRKAQAIGQDNMVDYAEAKLVENLQNNQQKAIEFFLRHNSGKYASNKTEMQYADQRGAGRLSFLPAGIDQEYYSSQIEFLEMMQRQKEARELVRDVFRDPNEPIDSEKFDPHLAAALYEKFPNAKAMYQQQLKEYRLSKERNDQPS